MDQSCDLRWQLIAGSVEVPWRSMSRHVFPSEHKSLKRYLTEAWPDPQRLPESLDPTTVIRTLPLLHRHRSNHSP